MPLAVGFRLVAGGRSRGLGTAAWAESAGRRARREVAGEVVLSLCSALGKRRSGGSMDPFTERRLMFNSHWDPPGRDV